MGKANFKQSKIKKNKTSTSFNAIESFLNKHHKKVFILFLIVFTALAALKFDVKISTDNDDALYIEAGYRYATQGSDYFYHANAPLYPMILGLLIYFLGYNIIFLKIFSFVCMLTALFLFYKAFINRIPKIILFSVIAIISVNTKLMFFSSMTYTESFYLMLQMLFFYLLFKFYDNKDEISKTLKAFWKEWLILGVMLTLISLTKNVAVMAVGAVFLFFIIHKDYKSALYISSSFVVVRLFYEVVKKLIWGTTDQYATQASILLQKHPYLASQGQEDFIGFIGRLIENTNQYLSRILFFILGLGKETTEPSAIISILVLLATLMGTYLAYKNKHKVLLFTSLFVFVLEGTTFIVLQPFWGQPRMILIVIPFLLMIIFYFLYQWLIKETRTHLQPFYVILIIILFSFGISKSLPEATKNIQVLKANLSGDLFYGYTPDWENYLKMSDWVGKNLPDTAVIACRKSPMSFIYGNGKKFYGIYNAPTTDPDSVVNNWKAAGITHIIDASLRRNPYYADGYTITTIKRMLEPVYKKYPEKIRLIKIIGETEPAFLFEFYP